MLCCPRGVGSVVPNAVVASAATPRSRSNDPFTLTLQNTLFQHATPRNVPPRSRDRRMRNYPETPKKTRFSEGENRKRSIGNGRFRDPKLKGDGGFETPDSTGAQGARRVSRPSARERDSATARRNADTTPREAPTIASPSVARTRASSVATAFSLVRPSVECVARAPLVSGHGTDGRDAPAPRGRSRRCSRARSGKR